MSRCQKCVAIPVERSAPTLISCGWRDASQWSVTLMTSMACTGTLSLMMASESPSRRLRLITRKWQVKITSRSGKSKWRKMRKRGKRKKRGRSYLRRVLSQSQKNKRRSTKRAQRRGIRKRPLKWKRKLMKRRKQRRKTNVITPLTCVVAVSSCFQRVPKLSEFATEQSIRTLKNKKRSQSPKKRKLPKNWHGGRISAPTWLGWRSRCPTPSGTV